jgi:hypothetical protein
MQGEFERMRLRRKNGDLCHRVDEATNQMQRRSDVPSAKQRDSGDCCARR